MKKILLSALSLGLMCNVFAQYLSYEVDSIPFKWEDFSTYDQATELIALAGEDEVYPLVIPFDFQYFENTYTQIFASVNGNASFGQSYQGIDFNRENLCHPVASLYDPTGGQYSGNPDNFIAVYWDDLFIDPTCTDRTDDTPKFVYRTIGAAPDRVFIISWEYFIYSGQDPCAGDAIGFSGYPGGFVSAQLRLHETSNIIEVHIGKNTLDMNTDFNSQFKEFQPTIAVENLTGDYAAYAACGKNGVSHEYTGYRFTPSAVAEIDTMTVVEYCDASGPDCAGSNGVPLAITEVSLEGDNTGFTNSTGCDEGYGDFSRSHLSYMSVGSPYLITFTGEGYDPLDLNFINSSVGFFVDWNEDGDFSDIDEVISVGVPINDFSTQTLSAVITPPATVAPGLKRLRVRLMGSFGDELARSCGFQDGGEVEDYSIVVGNPPPCATYVTPTDGATNQCQNTLLQWTADTTVTDGYYVYIGKTGDNLIRVDSIGDKTTMEYLATGLSVSTSYDWKIVPFSSEGTAIFCDTSTFTTGANLDPTLAITVDGVESTGGVIDVCHLSLVNLSGITTDGTFSGNVNNPNWTGDVLNISATNALDVEFMSDTLGKLYFYGLEISDDNGCTTKAAVVLRSTLPNNVTISQSGDSLTASPDTLTTITWFKVGTPDSMVATGSSFKPERSPSDYYAVVIDDNGCESEKSNIISYDWQVSISENTNTSFSILVYPNPAINSLTIDMGENVENTTVKLVDITGRTLNNWNLSGNNQKTNIDLNQPTGIYMLLFQQNGSVIANKQLIIQ